MNTSELLVDSFGRIREGVRDVLEDLSDLQLAARPEGTGNSIAWLVWHLTRIQDDHVAKLADLEQRWTADGWFDRFDLPFETGDTGFGHEARDVAVVRPSAALLLGYFETVHAQTVTCVEKLSAADLDRVVDEHWNPPVTAGIRLVSVVNDDMQHVGQAAYVRGLITAMAGQATPRRAVRVGRGRPSVRPAGRGRPPRPVTVGSR